VHVEELLANPGVREIIGLHYRRGVEAAIEGYPQARADEDTVTGALGQALLGRGAFQLSDGRVVTWNTSYTRFGSGGRSDGAEPRYGADGIFEIQLTDDDGITTRKSLLFQAKKEAYTYGDARLRRQARQIASVPGGAIVIDYRPGRFVALDAGAIAGGRDGGLVERDLADVLAEQFVVCTRGSSAYFFDPDAETLSVFTVSGRLIVRRLPITHRIRTTVRTFPLG
jgi:hypothetical protein